MGQPGGSIGIPTSDTPEGTTKTKDIELRINDKDEQTQALKVEADPTLPAHTLSNEMPEEAVDKVLRRKRED